MARKEPEPLKVYVLSAVLPEVTFVVSVHSSLSHAEYILSKREGVGRFALAMDRKEHNAHGRGWSYSPSTSSFINEYELQGGEVPT